MPKGTKISPAERRSWLESYENGQRMDVIARNSDVRETLEDLLLLHFVPSTCSICKRLGGD